MWVGKEDDSTTLQSIYSMHWWPSFQRGRIEICGRVVKSILSNCSEMLIRTPWKGTILICICGRYQNWLVKSRVLVRLGKFSWKTLVWENQHHSSTMFIWNALKENARLARILWTISEACSNEGFLPGLQRNCQKQKPRGNLMPQRYLLGPMTWKVMQRNAWKDISNLRIRRLNSYLKSQHHAWMTINLKKKMNQ